MAGLGIRERGGTGASGSRTSDHAGETGRNEADEPGSLRRREVEGFDAKPVPPQAQVHEASVEVPGCPQPDATFINRQVARHGREIEDRRRFHRASIALAFSTG